MNHYNRLLVVEDDPAWIGIYQRSARHFGYELHVAPDLEAAKDSVSRFSFPVVLLDLGLDEIDEKNLDGMQVGHWINRNEEGTSIIVVSGRGGVGTTRDAIKHFGAFDVLEKVGNEMDPTLLGDLLAKGAAAYVEHKKHNPVDVKVFMRRGIPGWDWDHEILEVCKPKGGIETLYRFLDLLVLPFTPLVYPAELQRLHRDKEHEVVLGFYWSRAIGKPLCFVFGNKDNMQALSDEECAAKLRKLVPANSFSRLKQVIHVNVIGRAFEFDGLDRYDFAT